MNCHRCGLPDAKQTLEIKTKEKGTTLCLCDECLSTFRLMFGILMDKEYERVKGGILSESKRH